MALFLDHIMTDPYMSQEFRNWAKSVVVLNGNNVADYFYNSDAMDERWDIGASFPNLAPPFDNFWIDFTAPMQMRNQHGNTQDWPSVLPLRWGIAVEAVERPETGWMPQTTEERQKYRQEISNQLKHMSLAMRQICAKFPDEHGKVPDIMTLFRSGRWKGHVNADETRFMYRYLHHTRVLTEASLGNWGEVAKLYEDIIGTRWCMRMNLFVDSSHGERLGRRMGTRRTWSGSSFDSIWSWEMYINEDGTIPRVGDLDYQADQSHYTVNYAPSDEFQQIIERAVAEAKALHRPGNYVPDIYTTFFQMSQLLLMPALMTITLLHCKNVVTQVTNPVQPPAVLKKSVKRRGGEARKFLRYHTLVIEPMKEVLRTEGKSDEIGLRRALHLVRSHFADYRDGRGLFGKHHGLYWVPMHLRGDKREGIVGKDYCVLPQKVKP